MTKKLSLNSLRKIIKEEVEKATLTEMINVKYTPKGRYDAEVGVTLSIAQAKRLLDLLSDKDDHLANEFRVELGDVIKKHEAETM